MKSLPYLLSLISVSIWNQTASAQTKDAAAFVRPPWVALNAGILTQTTGISLVASGTAPGTVYAGSGLGLLGSDDNGASWRKLMNFGAVGSLASGGAQVLYAVTGSGFFRSLDGGQTWTGSGPKSGLFFVTVDPSNPSTVYGTGGSAVYKSLDQAATWSLVYDFGGSNGPPGWVGVDPKNSSVLYASFVTGGTILKSIDGGKSWNSIFSGGGYISFAAPVLGLAIDPQNSSNLYAGSFTTFPLTPPTSSSVNPPGGISKSSDGGQTWRIIQKGFSDVGFVRNIVIDPANSNRLFASFVSGDYGGAGVFASTDAGETWTQVYNIPSVGQDSMVFFVAAAAGVVYAGYADGSLPRGGMVVSLDGGMTWNDANRGLAYYDLSTFAAASSPNVLYTGGSQGLFKSTDSGADWDLLSVPQIPPIGGFPGGNVVNKIVTDPVSPNIVYLIVAAAGGCEYTQQNLFKSTDGGGTWNNMSPAETGCIMPYSLLTVDPVHSQILYLAENDPLDDGFDLVKSTDGGTTWASLWDPGSSIVSVLAFDPANTSTLYAALEGFVTGDVAGLFKSSDGGATWNPTGLANVTLTALAIDPFDSMNLYAAESQTVLASADGGATWSNATTGLQSISGIGTSFTSLVADSAHKGVLYLGTSAGGIYRTTDAGQTWSPISTRLAGSGVRQLSIVSGSVYAVTTDGILKLSNP